MHSRSNGTAKAPTRAPPYTSDSRSQLQRFRLPVGKSGSKSSLQGSGHRNRRTQKLPNLPLRARPRGQGCELSGRELWQFRRPVRSRLISGVAGSLDRPRLQRRKLRVDLDSPDSGSIRHWRKIPVRRPCTDKSPARVDACWLSVGTCEYAVPSEFRREGQRFRGGWRVRR